MERLGLPSIYKASRSIKRRENCLLYNALHSIFEDSVFVAEIDQLWPELPLLANLRCGLWYSSRFHSNCYFKSTDSHTNNWSFSTSRLNLHVATLAGPNRVRVKDGRLPTDPFSSLWGCSPSWYFSGCACPISYGCSPCSGVLRAVGWWSLLLRVDCQRSYARPANFCLCSPTGLHRHGQTDNILLLGGNLCFLQTF